jgi:Alpha/beta hydrolase domain
MDIRIDSVQSFAEGRSFGKAGSYERLKGVARGLLDPTAPQNSGIVDLEKAPRNARGLVEYEVDVDILRPADPALGNGVLFYEVTNRGNKLLGRLLHGIITPNPTDLNDPKTSAHAGNAFLFERGVTVVWAGWDPTVPSRDATMTVRFPLALEDGKPMVRRVREEFQVGKRIPETFKTIALTYPAASLDKTRARLMARVRESDPRIEIPRDAWEFVDARHVRLLPEGRALTPLAIYEFWYEATNSRVTGISFAATRDLISFLRHDAASPLANASPKHAIAFGISQSARFLRHFLELGMNRDLRGHRVFDGVFAHTGGAAKIFANHSFAEPNRTAAQHEDRLYPDAWFPFSTATTTDPFSGRTDSLLRRDDSDPLFIQTNSSAEYWQKGASLLTIDALGRVDLGLPENSRVYMIAGTQHASSPPAAERGPVANQGNPQSVAPAIRALMDAMIHWIVDGTPPPASRVPSLKDGTAVAANALRFPKVPDFATPPGANVITTPIDWIDPPGSPDSKVAKPEGEYVTLVSQVDTDGNETAGIRLPPVGVPLATYTGWNVYREFPSELGDRDGSYVPFSRTKAERDVNGDTRPSLEERYGSLDGYVVKAKGYADWLVAERLLLPADAKAYVDAAKACRDFAAPAVADAAAK